ncbi:hypothetical protein A946_06185 [Methylacidiphilum kamchatkense Kam1]|uniref:Glycosyltransferase 2-like domain-containing protein n=1 Tax=Methylacidiphilum kamchatkense Kam1 TaxID=1202785 RepID=A0ABR4ZXS0_9BACT|nr:glycosyltransferase family A protein [Methylacidiphilum kamchatkense]KIE58478.1 hypothetical protein A946_06185 [Methylacidiphilum kamchatkense Kam1]
MKRFLISIGIPVYNGERFLRESIKSALSQSWSEKEILVVDDGSTDSTQSIIRSFQGNIRSFRIEHQGVSKARNVILKESKGLWIQYLDADDYLLEDKIETQIKECPNIQKYDVLLGGLLVEEWERGQRKKNCFQPEYLTHTYLDPFIQWFNRYNPNVAGCLFLREALLKIGGWNESLRFGSEDNELYMRIFQSSLRCFWTCSKRAVYRENWTTKSLSKSYPVEVLRTEIKLFDQMVEWLQQKNMLSEQRKLAACRAYFRILEDLALFRYDEALATYSRLLQQNVLPMKQWYRKFSKSWIGRIFGFPMRSWLRRYCFAAKRIEKKIIK